MKILFLRSNGVNPDSRVEKEVASLIENGHHVEILAWDRSENYQLKKEKLHLMHSGATIYRIGIKSSFGGGMRKNLFPLMKFQYCIFKFIMENHQSYDAIHACDFDTAFIAGILAKKFHLKFVYDIFDYYVDSFSVPAALRKVIENMDIRTINRADSVIICTEKRKKQIEKANPQKLYVIHNSPPRIRDIKEISLDDPVKIAYIGILQKGRMIEELVDIVSKNKNFELHIAGFGQLEEMIIEYSEKYSNIVFYGQIQYQKTLEIENECQIMTALYDPYIANHFFAAPNKFYEALMLGRPLIMVKKTGMSEVIESNHLGVTIDYTKESLNQGLLYLRDNKKQWKDMSEKMKKIYTNHYSWETMSVRLNELYNDL